MEVQPSQAMPPPPPMPQKTSTRSKNEKKQNWIFLDPDVLLKNNNTFSYILCDFDYRTRAIITLNKKRAKYKGTIMKCQKRC